MMATVYNAIAVRRRLTRDGESSVTDQIRMANYWLEISLMGILLFLGFTINRLHYCLRDLSLRRKQSRVLDDVKPAASEEFKALEQERSKLQEKIAQLQMQLEKRDHEAHLLKAQLLKTGGEAKQLTIQLEEKTKEATSAEANALALRKQSEGFLLEYDRLLEENQILRRKLFSENKKDM